MPYVITVRARAALAAGSVVAVATLDEARTTAEEIIDRTTVAIVFEYQDAALKLPESGGTIRLPDGTVIKVAPIHRETLAAEGGYPRAAFVSTSDLIDAYNAAQEA